MTFFLVQVGIDICPTVGTFRNRNTKTTMTLPRRAPCSSRQAQAYVEKEMNYFKQEMEEAQTQRENDNKNGGTRKRKTSLFSGVSGGKRLNQHASSVLFGWLEEHMENP